MDNLLKKSLNPTSFGLRLYNDYARETYEPSEVLIINLSP